VGLPLETVKKNGRENCEFVTYLILSFTNKDSRCVSHLVSTVFLNDIIYGKLLGHAVGTYFISWQFRLPGI